MKDRALVYLAVAQTLIWSGTFYLFPALLLRWEVDLGWSKTDLTLAITLAIFVSALVSPFAGRLIDRHKGALMLTTCTFVSGICLIMLSRVDQLWQFYLVWALIGAAMGGCLYEPCFALITRARGEKAKRGIILITLIAGFASTISFPMAYSLSEAFGWRIAVQVFSVVVIFVAAPLMWVGAHAVEESGASTKPSSNQPLSQPLSQQREFLRTPAFWFLAFGFALMAVTHGVTLHHLLPILDDRGIRPEVAVVTASFVGPMQVAGRLTMVAVERHVSIHGIAVTCFLVVAISVCLLFGAGYTPALLVAFVILFGGGHGTVSIIRPLITRDILGQNNFGAKSGALAMPFLIGSASAPYLGSYIWNWGGYDTVLLTIAVVAVLGLCAYLAANKLTM